MLGGRSDPTARWDLFGFDRRTGVMPTIRMSAAGAALAALVLVVPATPTAADGLPLPVEDSPNGVVSHDRLNRYLTVSLGGRTAVIAQRAKDGAVTSRTDLPGRFGVPLVAYDSTAGGVSANGRTLVLVRPRAGFPRATTTFAVMATKPFVRLRRIIRLRGDFSYDALSPDGRSLFLINYISPGDPTKYRVRVYDLARNRLDPKPIVDPREPPDEMNGLPVTRVSSPDGRWAYTLYEGTGSHPFIHALDTRDRKAFCIDLDGPAFAGNNAYELKVAVAQVGARLDIRRANKLLAAVDTKTFKVRDAAAVLAAGAGARAVVDDDGTAIPGALWPALAIALLAGVLLTRRRITRRHVVHG
jgi:hypothetical protein